MFLMEHHLSLSVYFFIYKNQTGVNRMAINYHHFFYQISHIFIYILQLQ